MALKYLSNIDLGGLEIKNAKPYVITTADQDNFADSSHADYLLTSSANIGKMYWNSQTLTFLIWKGTGWVVLDGSGDISSVGLTADDGNSLSDTAGAVNFTISGDTGISTTASGSTIEIDLDNTAVTAGDYGSSTQIPSISVDAQGRITAASNNSITVGNATITIDGGADLEINTGSGANGAFTTNQGTNETITLDHSNVTRTDASDATSTLSFGSTFTPFTALGSSTKGHVVSSQKTVFTLPSLGTAPGTALEGDTDILDVSNDHLLTRLAALESTGGASNEDIVIGTDAGDTVAFTGAIKVNASSSFLSSQFTFEDPTSGKPLLVLKNTNDDTAGSTLRFTKETNNSASDNDEIGQIEFKSDDSGNTQHLFASIKGIAKDVTNNDEIGKLKLGVSTGQTTNSYQDGLVIEGHANDDRVDVVIGNGTNSVTTIAGDLTVTGSHTIVNSTDVEIQDINITVAKGATTSANANGSGITFSNWSSAPVLSWDHSNTRLNVNKAFHVAGNITLADNATVDGIDIGVDVAANTLKNTNVTTDLGHNTSSTTLEVTSSDGSNTTLPVATTSAGGVMSAAQVTALNTATTPTEVTAQIDAYSKTFVISGTGSAKTFTLNHQFNTFKVKAEILEYGNAGSGATYATVYTDIKRSTVNDVVVEFAVNPVNNQDYLVLLTKVTN